MAYPWMSPDWVAKALAAELKVQPLLSRRRWTDKDVIGGHVIFWPEWPIIPKGVGADYEGERALRVFIEIADGPEAHRAPQEAVLVAKLSGADAVRAGLTKDDVFLVVTHRFFDWAAGALGFDKKVLLSLSQSIIESSLTHKDAEIWPELTWIVPMRTADRKYYYAVLPLVGMGGVIDPAKGNPGIFRDLQADPYRHFVWDVVDEVIDGGTSAWGTAATSGDGAATLFAIKLRFVNFLRGLADTFAEEDLERMARRGNLDRAAVGRAVADGLFAHRPDAERIIREGQWLERADCQWWERFKDLCDRFTLMGGYAQVITAYLNGLGQGWSPDPTVQLGEAAGLVYDLVDPTTTLDAIARLVAMTREGTDRDGEAFKLFMTQLQKAAIQLRHSGVLRKSGVAGIAQDLAEGSPDEKETEYQRMRRQWMPESEYRRLLAEVDRRFRT